FAFSLRLRMSSASCPQQSRSRHERLRLAVSVDSRIKAKPRCESAAPGLLEGDRTAGGPDRQWQGAAIFRRRWSPQINNDQAIRLCIAKQNSRTLPSSAVASALRVASGSGPARPPPE
ncbi:MAG: hypothetical protein E6772_18415, partial [Dysgonomonas sp.]|nr:hypothetical protein [Dysgonomonas sp.]